MSQSRLALTVDADACPEVSKAVMNGIRVLLVAAIGVMAGCSPPGIMGDGVVTTTNWAIADFSALSANGAYQIHWSSGKPGITISTDRNLLPLITTSVSGNT